MCIATGWVNLIECSCISTGVKKYHTSIGIIAIKPYLDQGKAMPLS
jgi:hypothetical protein